MLANEANIYVMLITTLHEQTTIDYESALDML
jgi:hypothetical protein